MKYYKSKDDEIFAYESDGSQDSFIKEGLVLLNDEELAAIRERQADALAPTPEQQLQAANKYRDELLILASIRVSPLQDAVDLEVATKADRDSLKLWKQYRVEVNRVTAQPSYPLSVDWPLQPSP